jgi:hypothetical protein
MTELTDKKLWFRLKVFPIASGLKQTMFLINVLTQS